MMATLAAITPGQRRLTPILLTVAAVLFGATLATGSWLTLAVIGAGALVVAALFSPMLALALMLWAGPARALLAAAFPGQAIDPGQVGMGLFAFAWLMQKLARRQRRFSGVSFLLPFLFYLFAAALSLAVQQTASPWAGVQELIKWAEMLVVAFMVADLCRERALGSTITIILLAGVGQSIMGLWQFGWRGHGPTGFRIFGDYYRAYGTFEQPNPFAGFLGLLWPLAASLAFYFGWQWLTRTSERNVRGWALFILSLATTALMLSALYVSFSRGAWLGAAAAAGVMLMLAPRQRWLGLGLAAGGALALVALNAFGVLPAAIAARFAEVGSFLQVVDVRGAHINDANFAIIERLAHWQAAFNMFNANPWFGVGTGNFDAAYPAYRLLRWQYGLGHAHMIFLNVLAETGVLGLTTYLGLWAAVIATAWRAAAGAGGVRRAVAIALMASWAHLTTHQLLDSLYVNNIPLFIGALLGLLLALTAPHNTTTDTAVTA